NNLQAFRSAKARRAGFHEARIESTHHCCKRQTIAMTTSPSTCFWKDFGRFSVEYMYREKIERATFKLSSGIRFKFPRIYLILLFEHCDYYSRLFKHLNFIPNSLLPILLELTLIPPFTPSK